MKKVSFSNAVLRSRKIREIYHRLELQHHGSEWTPEEDALAFLTDAGLIGRLTMAHQGRWPMDKEGAHDLSHKLGECLWWLIVLAERMEIGAESALDVFLTRTEQQLKRSIQTSSLQKETKGRTKKSLSTVAGSTMKKKPNQASEPTAAAGRGSP